MDREIAVLAHRQHGVVSRRQLAAIGVTETMMRNRMRRGQLLQLHRGVYAVGHRQLRREGYWLAAVLAVGPGAALSHRAAAALHGIGASGVAVDVSTAKDRRSAKGIRVHGRRRLSGLDVAVVDGIPVTTVARTLVDLAATVPRDRLTKALSEAEARRLLDVRAIEVAVERLRQRRGDGHAVLRAALAEQAEHGPDLTRSELEVRFLALVTDHGLPRPRTNAVVSGMEVDALWPEPRVVAELDGYAHHRSKPAFQRDRTKANALTAKGYRVFRYTYDDVIGRPAAVAAELRPLVAP